METQMISTLSKLNATRHFFLLILGLCFGLFICSCKTDSPFTSQFDNQATSNLPAKHTARVDCASCHAYPIPSGRHKLHLFNEESGSPNGSLTCSDCHFQSIQTQIQDLGSAFLYIPKIQNGITLGNMASEEVVDYLSLIKFVELFQDSFPRQTLPLKTGSKHMNNEINLTFAPNTLRPSDRAHWNPKRMSCSMIECHSNPEKEELWNPK
jgi:hypothetical protein